ncbi:alkaline phosphatase D family protein [Citricoccus sp. GCM10030269]|uniref:alkaline phosphatase D family protein n=1 Tax=Citricoccus sp. GCM10030269 TaxID=3273388 RepID=UPI00360BB147
MSSSSRVGIGRRGFLGLAGAGALGATVAASSQPAWATPSFQSNPFGLGVASGDPLPGGVVLWTRIAPDPIAADGLGGVHQPHRQIPVKWEISKDDSFGPHAIVQRGVAHAKPELAHSVHVEVDGLLPDREYWYRFRVGGEISPVGRTRTAPALDAQLNSLAFAFTSCQAYSAGYFTALRHMSEDDLAVAFHLGDYIYEGGAAGKVGRPHLPDHEIQSLTDYRIRYGQYKSDADLQAAHASVAFVVVPDDHEVENNWAADRSQPDNEADQDPAVFLQRRAFAFQAYYENLPLRRSSVPAGPDMQLFRRIKYGQLADFHVLDTRQYRSYQNQENNNELRWDPSRTLLGDRQEKWLIDGMTESTAHWNVLAQQSKMTESDDIVGPGETYPNDNWDGYAYSRAELFDAIHERDIRNMVAISGDAHVNIASDLKPRFKEEDSPLVGAEFLGTSISSGGDGVDINNRGRQRLAENPHIKFYNQRRGYQRCVVTPETWRTEYLVMPYVTEPGASIHTRAVGWVENGNPGIAQMEDREII